jgi:hypothetical protein
MRTALGSDCGGKHRQNVDADSGRIESMPLLRNRHRASLPGSGALSCLKLPIIVGALTAGWEIEMKTILSVESHLHSQQDRSVHVISIVSSQAARQTP